MRRVLIISTEHHVALALATVLRDNGHLVWHETDSVAAMLAMKEFSPNSMITVSDSAVFVCNRDSTEISELPRPVDTNALLRVLEMTCAANVADLKF